MQIFKIIYGVKRQIKWPHNFKFLPSKQINCIILGINNHNQAMKQIGKWQVAKQWQFRDAPSFGRDDKPYGRD